MHASFKHIALGFCYFSTLRDARLIQNKLFIFRYVIFNTSPHQLQDIPMKKQKTKVPRWAGNAGEVTGVTSHLWNLWLLCLEQLPSPPLPPAGSTFSSEVKTTGLSDLFNEEIQHGARGEISASRRRKACREWASISSFFLLFLSVKRMCSQASGTRTRTGGTEAREAFLWKNIHRYVAPDQPSYPGANIYLLLHWWWIWSTHKLGAGKKDVLCLCNPRWHSGR